MKLIALASIAAAGLLAAACSKATPTATPALATPQPSPAATSASSPTATTVPGQTAASAQGFFLLMASPADESVVKTPTVTVKGQTTADAVVSVNGQVATVDGEGNFSAAVTLQQGPNAIDVVASDFQGNQKGAVVNVIYAP